MIRRADKIQARDCPVNSSLMSCSLFCTFMFCIAGLSMNVLDWCHHMSIFLIILNSTLKSFFQKQSVYVQALSSPQLLVPAMIFLRQSRLQKDCKIGFTLCSLLVAPATQRLCMVVKQVSSFHKSYRMRCLIKAG